MICPACGTPYASAHRRCPECRNPVNTGPYPVLGLGWVVVALLGVTVLVDLIATLVLLIARPIVDRAAEQRDPGPLATLIAVDSALHTTLRIGVVVTGVVVIGWLWRARRNVDAIPGAVRGPHRVWTVAGWLVPFVNLIMPFLVMGHVARVSLGTDRAPVLMRLWWAAWVITVACDRTDLWTVASDGMPRVLGDVASYGSYLGEPGVSTSWRLFLSAVLLVAGASLAIVVVRISAAQQRRIDAARPGAPAGSDGATIGT